MPEPWGYWLDLYTCTVRAAWLRLAQQPGERSGIPFWEAGGAMVRRRLRPGRLQRIGLSVHLRYTVW